MAFGERLRRARERKNLTQIELGKLLNVSDATINRYEKEHRFPDKDTLRKLADILECSVDYLLGRTDDPKPPGEDNSTEIDLEEIMKKEGIMFDGIPLDEEDKEDILEVMKIAWKTIQKRKQK